MQFVEKVDWQWQTAPRNFQLSFPAILPSLGRFPIPRPEGGFKKSPPTAVQTTANIQPSRLKPSPHPFVDFYSLELKWRPTHGFVFFWVPQAKARFCRLLFINTASVRPCENIFKMTTFTHCLQVNVRALTEDWNHLTNLIWITKSCWPKPKSYLLALRK